MPTSLEPGRSTANRLFAVLGAFEEFEHTPTLSEISAHAELPMATTHRIVRELLEAGAIERNDDGRFQIGLRLWEIGSLAPRQRDLRRIARPVMDGLYEATEETVQLAIAHQRLAFCVEKVSGLRSAANVTEVAGGLPLHATGVGKIILAFSSTDGLAALGRRRLRRFTARTVTDHALLADEVAATRQNYVGFCREERTPGTASVAAPIFGSEGEFVAALGVLTPASRDIKRFIPLVRAAAQTISNRLGMPPDRWPSALARSAR